MAIGVMYITKYVWLVVSTMLLVTSAVRFRLPYLSMLGVLKYKEKHIIQKGKVNLFAFKAE